MSNTEIGIKSYGSYIPSLRLDRREIIKSVGWANPGQFAHGKGQRAVCDFDEDTITMAVEAARRVIPESGSTHISALVVGSTTLPFADRLNASVISSALGLDDALESFDVTGSQRAGTSALRLASRLASATSTSDVLCVAVDQRRGKPGSIVELVCGDGAAALTLGQDDVIARILAHQVTTIDFVTHFRQADQRHDYVWEERWVREEGYLKLVEPVLQKLLYEAQVSAGDIDHFILPCPIARVREAISKRMGINPEAVANNFQKSFGETGAAHSLVMLCDVLDKAKPGEKILVTGFGQGCETFLLETTPLLAKKRAKQSVALNSAESDHIVPYVKYLANNEQITPDFGPRAEADRQTALSAAYRHTKLVNRLVAGECPTCGTVQFPKSTKCVSPNCNHNGPQAEHPLADETATVCSITTDYLGFSRSPPNRYGMIEFTSGARMTVNFACTDQEEPPVGSQVQMTYRLQDIDTLRNYHRYCWKAQPVKTDI